MRNPDSNIYNRANPDDWLVFFYGVPSKPVSKRMKIWRRLIKAGSLHFKGSVYILPFSDDNLEFFQWLISEINSMGGEGAFVRAGNIETVRNSEIVQLFNQQKDNEYKLMEKGLDEIERRLQSIKKGTKGLDEKRLLVQMNKIIREFEDAGRTDFFNAGYGGILAGRIEAAHTEIRKIKGFEGKKEKSAEVVIRKIDEYRGRTWVTRKRPFVDRIASAWLIKRFIDKEALFEFVDERDIGGLDDSLITFDVQGGIFTHIGNLCTYEVILRSFGLKNKALQKIGEIVHELDIKDGRYRASEAQGIEDILIGIRKTAENDLQVLEKGMAVFDMLYASKI